MGINVNFINKVVYITSPTTSVLVQALVDAIRDAEDELGNLSYKIVIDAVGKAPLGGGVYTAITMDLNTDWYIEFWDGCVLGVVSGGNVTSGKDSRPVRAAIGSGDTVLQLSAEAATVVAVGSGVTQQDKVDIAQEVWGHTSASFILKTINNKKKLIKESSVWYLVIYDDNGTSEIIRKAVKDKDGNNITDIAAGVLTEELANSV